MIKIQNELFKITFENNFFFEFMQFLFDDCKKKNNNILLNIKDAVSLDKYTNKNTLTYEMGCQFFEDVANQMSYLEKNGYSVPVFSISDFWICDGRFIFIQEKNIVQIENNSLSITKPFLDKEFFSPEMKQVKKIPSECPIKSWMFSIALLISTLMKLTTTDKFNWKQQVNSNDERFEFISSEILLLEAIYNTKLYWALERCFYNDYKKRYFYLI